MFVIDEKSPYEVAIFIDMSGSSYVQMHVIKAFVKMYHDKLPTIQSLLGDNYCLHFVTFSNVTMEIIKITPDNIGDLNNFKYHCGGAADLQCCWKYMLDNQIGVSIVFTDGLLPWGTDPGMEINFIIHSDIKLHSYPPYGNTQRYDP